MSCEHRTISIGGLTYDLFVDITHDLVVERGNRTVLELPLGSKIRIQRVTGTCGGGASNTSVGLARLGCHSACCGVVGNDQWGEELMKNLRREGVDTQGTTVVESEPSSFSIIILAQAPDRVILNTPGTNQHLHDVTFDRERASSADWVYLNHLHSASHVIEDDIVALLNAAHPPHLTWNPGGHQIEAGLNVKNNAALAAQSDLLLLNKEEATLFTGMQTIDESLTVVLKSGCRIACITDGKEGAFASDGEHRFHCPVLAEPIVDTTGAGDAFGVGCTWALLRGLHLPTALRAGTINATSVIGRIGAEAGLLTETEMQSRLDAPEPIVTSTSF